MFEEDFRFEQDDNEFESDEAYTKSRARLPACAREVITFATAAETGVPPCKKRRTERDQEQTAPRPQSTRLVGKRYELAQNAPGKVWRETGPTEYLQDLVQIATAAHRHGRGSFIWAGWCPGSPGSKPRSQTTLSFGSHLIMMTRQGALSVGQAFLSDPELTKAGHIDLKLKYWCKHFHEQSGACYLVPAIGNYTAHVSGCSKEHLTSIRPNGWGDKWTRQGTRKSHDLQERDTWICGWTRKGNTQWLHKIDVPGETLGWRTFWAGAGPRPGPTTASREGEVIDVDENDAATAGASSSAAPAFSQAALLTARAKRLARRKRSEMQYRIWEADPQKVRLVEKRPLTVSSGRAAHGDGPKVGEPSPNPRPACVLAAVSVTHVANQVLMLTRPDD